jgi:hypothetical protein
MNESGICATVKLKYSQPQLRIALLERELQSPSKDSGTSKSRVLLFKLLREI